MEDEIMKDKIIARAIIARAIIEVIQAARAIPMPPRFKTGSDHDEYRETICRGCYHGFDWDNPQYSHRAGTQCPHMRLEKALQTLNNTTNKVKYLEAL
jgi:hypothetical protein